MVLNGCCVDKWVANVGYINCCCSGIYWGSTKESHKWNKKRILALRKERSETQKSLESIFEILG